MELLFCFPIFIDFERTKNRHSSPRWGQNSPDEDRPLCRTNLVSGPTSASNGLTLTLVRQLVSFSWVTVYHSVNSGCSRICSFWILSVKTNIKWQLPFSLCPSFPVISSPHLSFFKHFLSICYVLAMVGARCFFRNTKMKDNLLSTGLWFGEREGKKAVINTKGKFSHQLNPSKTAPRNTECHYDPKAHGGSWMTTVCVSNKSNAYFPCNPHIPAALKPEHLCFLFPTCGLLSWPTLFFPFASTDLTVFETDLRFLPGLILKPQYWSFTKPISSLSCLSYIHLPGKYPKIFHPISLLNNQSLNMKIGNEQNEWWALATQHLDNELSTVFYCHGSSL